MKPVFFRTPADFRRWLAAHHDSGTELWVGFHKKGSGKESITWPESVDEALCVGWIDGIRKRLDEVSYVIRFTPRKAISIWSAINIRRVDELTAAGRMQANGLAAYQRRQEKRSGIYAYEQRPADLIEPYAGMLKKNRKAAQFYGLQPASYRQVVTWWVITAKQEATRLKRIQKLIEFSASGRRL